MNRLMLVTIVTLISAQAMATYNANMSGELEGVWSYADSDAIYFRLKNQPSSHPSCNPTYFVIDSSVATDRRKAMFSRLLVAYTSNEIVNIGYDNTGNCADGYIRAHRAG